MEIYAEIELINSANLSLLKRNKKAKINSVKAQGLVDLNINKLIVNKEIQERLNLVSSRKEVIIINDIAYKLPIIGPIEIKFQNRRATVDALIFENIEQPIIGRIPYNSLDVVINSTTKEMEVNPKFPDCQTTILKGIRKG